VEHLGFRNQFIVCGYNSPANSCSLPSKVYIIIIVISRNSCVPHVMLTYNVLSLYQPQVKMEIARGEINAHSERENWDAWDPMLIAEGLFAAANIFRYYAPHMEHLQLMS